MARKFETEYRASKTTEVLKSENNFRLSVDLRLDVLERGQASLGSDASVLVDRVLRAIETEIAPRAAEIEELLAGYREGVPAGLVTEEADGRQFLTPTRRTAILADLRGGVDVDGDTLAKLLALVLLRAPAASPDLTGTPTAPTAPNGTATAQIATTGFVAAAVDALKSGAPAAYDTLIEIAAWIANDETAEAGLVTALGNRLRLDAAQNTTIAERAQALANLGLDDIDLVIAELSLGQADALNVAQFLGATGNRFADSFDATTYVDVAGATNLNTAVAGLLKPALGSGVAISPTMTGAAAPAPWAVSSDTDKGAGYEAWRAFDGIINTTTSSGWRPTVAALPHWNALDAGAGNAITAHSYQVRIRSDGLSDYPTAWTLEGSANGSSWSTLDTQSGVSWTTAGQVRTFTITTPAAYRHHRLNVSAAASNDFLLQELTLIGPPLANLLTVASTTFTASAAPTQAVLVARVNEIDAIALNTELVFEASRNGGTNWTALQMTDRLTIGGVHLLESAVLDLSGQPSGTSLKWRARTSVRKMIELHDVYFYWR